MTPNFALSLSFDGLRLLQRSDTGWLLVGEVNLDSPDLRAALAELRARAESLSDGPVQIKLLIPKEQIKYLALDGTMTTEDDIRLALEGATPYAVDDLVYDYTKGGGRTYVAAVARETLVEAEAFAIEHGMTPVSFAAVPAPFTFVGEVVFGPATAAGDVHVERDSDPVRMVGVAKSTAPATALQEPAATFAPAPPKAPEPEPEAAPAEPEVSEAEATAAADQIGGLRPDGTSIAGDRLVDALANTAEIEPKTGAKPAPDEALPVFTSRHRQRRAPPAPPVAEQTPAVAPEPVVDPEPPAPSLDSAPAPVEEPNAPAPEPAPQPSVELSKSAQSFQERMRMKLGDRMPPEPDAEAPRAPTPAPQALTFRDRMRERFGGSKPPEPGQPRFELPADDRPASSLVATRPAGAVSLDDRRKGPGSMSFTPRLGAASRGAALAPAASLGAPSTDVEEDAAAPPITGRSDAAIDERDVPALDAATRPSPIPDPAPEAPPKKARKGRKAAPPATRKEPTVAAAVSAAAATAPEAAEAKPGLLSRSRRGRAEPDPEAQKAAEEERERMTVFGARRSEPVQVGGKPRFLGLVLTVLLILFMAVVGALAAVNSDSFARWFGSDTDTPDVASDTSADPEPALASGGMASVPTSSAPDAPAARDDLPVAGDSGPDVVLDDAPDLLSDAPENAVAPEPEPEAATETAEVIAPQQPSAPIGQVLSPAEAQRIYAATGVWQRAPRLPVTPRTTALGEVPVPPTDDVDRLSQPVGLPETLASATDVRIPTPADPPPAGATFDRDDEGFILATADGTLTPDGILVFSGAPEREPPIRPGTVAPPPDVTDNLPEGAEVVASDGLRRIVGAAPVEVALRPAPEPAPEEEAPADPFAEAVALAAAEATADTDDAVEEATETAAVAFVDSRPVNPPVRPGTLSTSDVDVAVETDTGSETATDPETDSPDGLTIVSSAPVNPPTRTAPASIEPAAAPEAEPTSDVTIIDTALVNPPTRDDSDVAAPDAPAEAPASASPGVVFRDNPGVNPPTRPTPASADAPSEDDAAPVILLDSAAVDPPIRPGTEESDAADTIVAPTDAVPVRFVDTAAIDPPTRPAAVAAAAAAAAGAESDDSAALDTVPNGGVALTGLRPTMRPENITLAASQAPAELVADPALEGFRPSPRPDGLVPDEVLAAMQEELEEEPEPEAEIEDTGPDVEATLAAAAAALNSSVPAGFSTATRNAVPRSIHPDARPRNMATIVDRARRAAPRQQTTQPAAQQPAAQQPAATVARAAAPSGPTAGSVAQAATLSRAINLRQNNLIGIFGRVDDRRAMVRLSNGRFVHVKVGDRLDGGQVTSIGDSFLTYSRGGRQTRLNMPNG
ncbi:hypothetical protein [Pelagovum pacificum]|uniref:Uncharacterized protein n=1 Tax=Pelagovum pacificum TaxID=2588711 RepID=A0A5C5GFB4_9RHOB|nr:hypothetical protein [Pelagovum pacificum]QQA44007.1 hypothetical protein I8N54_05365 [Pelagovum pacificum]TNY32864.1 hypothetical protein FHY64_06195 [Pelagovum pacificum]